jgi:hypothetical protein
VIEVTNLDTGQLTTFTTAPAESGGFGGGIATPPLTRGRYDWRAKAVDATGASSDWAGPRSLTVGSNAAPGAPTLLGPASGAELRRIANEPFSISAVDPDGDVYSGTVVIRRAVVGTEVTRFATSLALSGGASSGLLLEPLAEGSYTWSAQAEDAHGARSNWSVERPFTVNPPPSVGGGLAVGMVSYPSPGIPLGLCEPAASVLELDSALAVFNTAIVGYVGPVAIDGSGQSTCESVQFATGQLVVDIEDTGASDSTLACAGLAGSYVRVGAVLTLELTGGCAVNSFAVSRVSISAAFGFAPAEAPTDLTGRIRNAVVGGAFVVRPE